MSFLYQRFMTGKDEEDPERPHRPEEEACRNHDLCIYTHLIL